MIIFLLFLLLITFAPRTSATTADNIWTEYFDDEHQLNYYHNPATGETKWEISKDDVVVKEEEAEKKNKAEDVEGIGVIGVTEQDEATTKGKKNVRAGGINDNNHPGGESGEDEGEEDGDYGDYGNYGDYGDYERTEDGDDDDIVDSNEDDLDPNADDVLDASEERKSLVEQHKELSESDEQRKLTKLQLEDKLAEFTTDGITLERETVDLLMQKGGLLNSDALAKLGLQVVERLDEVYVQKKKGSKNAKKCGTPKLPCKSIQLGIDRSSMNAKIFVRKGYYAGPGNVDLKIDGRRIELFSVPPQASIIDCRNELPLIDPLHSSGNTGIHDFQIQNCNLQDPNGRTLNGDIDSASIQFPNIKKIWDPNTQTYILDPLQLQLLQHQRNNQFANNRMLKSKGRTPSGKKRIHRNFRM